MMFKIFTILLSLFFSFSALAQERNIDNSRFFNVAVIQVLDKTIARASTLEIPVGEKKKFGTIEIAAHKCWQAPLDQRPESKILIEVFEKKSDKNAEKMERIFYGWIFASSPSISGIEHQVYDLTAINCKNN